MRRVPWSRLVSSGSPTKTSLTLSSTAVPAGTAVTLTAKVTSGKTAVTPGILDFCRAEATGGTGPALLKSAVLNAQGEAVGAIMLPAGSYAIRARFEGTMPYAPSESAAQSLTVEANSNDATKAVLTGVNGSKGKYSLGATLTSHAPAAPKGSLVFTDATAKTKLGSVALADSALGGYQPFGLISTGAKSGPNDLVAGDFNGDGIPDLAVPDSATGVVAVFLGKGDGTFQPAKFTSTGTGSMPLALAVGDFNADGKLDLVVALGNQGAGAILRGNGDGTFQAPRFASTAGSALYHPVALTIGDFNHDGRLDIATANNTLGASVLLGNGDGSFQPYKPLGSSNGPTWIAAGDFNKDGDLDLAITTAAGSVDISPGNGDGTFQGYTSVATGNGSNPQSLAVADLDDDGNLDLAVACYGANAVGVLLGNGDGTFLPIELYAAGAEPISVTVGDLDLDGIPDLVVTNLGSNSLSVFQGNGDGTFLPLPGYSTTSGSQPAAGVIADLDAEGAPEIVSVLYGSSALYVLERERIQGVVLKNVALSATKKIALRISYAGDALYAPAKSKVYTFPPTSEPADAGLANGSDEDSYRARASGERWRHAFPGLRPQRR
ncbi:MAG TPA: FG-GAP-like repeat-containing protein [Terracidiphilus sp.]|nr:FG-GAP-like repeat-containing protein [Terracidiphilus sp.]